MHALPAFPSMHANEAQSVYRRVRIPSLRLMCNAHRYRTLMQGRPHMHVELHMPHVMPPAHAMPCDMPAPCTRCTCQRRARGAHASAVHAMHMPAPCTCHAVCTCQRSAHAMHMPACMHVCGRRRAHPRPCAALRAADVDDASSGDVWTMRGNHARPTFPRTTFPPTHTLSLAQYPPPPHTHPAACV
eukprot:352114-Chlamydomonas_euryale.AAC.1